MNNQSIFDYMVEHIKNNTLEENFTLVNWNDELKSGKFVDGAADMLERYDVNSINERNLESIVNEIENAIILLSNGNFDEADRWFVDLGKKYRIINISYLIMEYLDENHEDVYLDNIFHGAMHLVTESNSIESVKAGLVILTMFQYDYQVKNIIRLLAQSDEFTYFAVRNMDEWENGNMDIFQVAQKVKGWGRVYAMEMLKPSNRYIRDWMLENGLNVNVPKEKLPVEYFEMMEKVKETDVSDEYIYCQIQPYGMSKVFSYIFVGEMIKVDDIVVISLGYDDELLVGKVVTCKVYSRDTLPYPLENTKVIVRVLENDEVIEEFPQIAKMEKISSEIVDDNDKKQKAIVTPINKDINQTYIENDQMSDKSDDSKKIDCHQNEIAELVWYIKNDNLDDILDWAILHHKENEDAKILEAVIDAYKYCIENEFKVEVAALNLGSLYYTGVKVKRDYTKAAKYYRMAAEKGSDQAMCNLGYCYYYGRHEDVAYDKAYKCFNVAALMGNINALYKLGDMYLNGYFVNVNQMIAIKLYERALDEIEPWDDVVPDLKLRLGKCYLRGIGVEQNLEYAMEMLCSAYAGLYAKRSIDPFVKGVIKNCRELIDECEKAMDDEFVEIK